MKRTTPLDRLGSKLSYEAQKELLGMRIDTVEALLARAGEETERSMLAHLCRLSEREFAEVLAKARQIAAYDPATTKRKVGFGAMPRPVPPKRKS